MIKKIVFILIFLFLNQNSYSDEFPYFGSWYSSESRYFLSVTEKETEFKFMGEDVYAYSGVCLNKEVQKFKVITDCTSNLNNIFTLEYNNKEDILKINHLGKVIEHKRALNLSKKDIDGQWIYIEGGVSGNDNGNRFLEYILRDEIRELSDKPTDLDVLEMYYMDVNDRFVSIINYGINNTYDFFTINLKSKTFNVHRESLNYQLFEQGYKIVKVLEDKEFNIESNIFERGDHWFNTIDRSGYIAGYIKITGDIKWYLISSGFKQEYLD